jgi:hypothetical protein
MCHFLCSFVREFSVYTAETGMRSSSIHGKPYCRPSWPPVEGIGFEIIYALKKILVFYCRSGSSPCHLFCSFELDGFGAHAAETVLRSSSVRGKPYCRPSWPSVEGAECSISQVPCLTASIFYLIYTAETVLRSLFLAELVF